MENLIPIKDVTKIVPVSVMTLRRLINQGAIPYRRIGSKYYFTESDLSEYLDSVRRPIRAAAEKE